MSAVGKILKSLFPDNYIPEGHDYSNDYRHVGDYHLDQVLGRKGLRASDNPYRSDDTRTGETANERWERDRRQTARAEILKDMDRHTRLALEGQFSKAVWLVDHPGEVKWTEPGEMPSPEMMRAAHKYVGK